jgi:primase-polymerase (primpol)-like protein
MRELEQWLCWRLEERDGKPTKIPYSPRTGSRASSTDSATWATFSEAVAARKEHGYSGIGFVFSEDDAYCGVDLDKCRDSETGALAEWAQEIVSGLDSYTEISPSGTGVHVICQGELPAGRSRKGSVEAYQSGRYFTVTGKHLEGTPETVEERTRQLQAMARRVFGEPESNGNGLAHTEQQRGAESPLEDDELIRLASESNDGGKFRELFSGGYFGHTSHSEAVAALLLKLAFWSGRDASQMERIFRRSGLMYKKFDSRRGQTTWGAQEIQKAIEKTRETYTAPGGRLTFGAGVGVNLSGANANGHAAESTTEATNGHTKLSAPEIGIYSSPTYSRSASRGCGRGGYLSASSP